MKPFSSHYIAIVQVLKSGGLKDGLDAMRATVEAQKEAKESIARAEFERMSAAERLTGLSRFCLTRWVVDTCPIANC